MSPWISSEGEFVSAGRPTVLEADFASVRQCVCLFRRSLFDTLARSREFTKVAANALSALASVELGPVARSVSTVGNAETLTGDMEATLDRIAPLLPGEILSQLRASLGQIEILIAKDGALERLERFKDGA